MADKYTQTAGKYVWFTTADGVPKKFRMERFACWAALAVFVVMFACTTVLAGFGVLCLLGRMK